MVFMTGSFIRLAVQWLLECQKTGEWTNTERAFGQELCKIERIAKRLKKEYDKEAKEMVA